MTQPVELREVEHVPPPARADQFKWVSLHFAGWTALIATVCSQYENFVPCGRPKSGAIFAIRDILGPLGTVCEVLLIGLAMVLLVRTAIALVRRRPRRALSFFCSILAISVVSALPSWFPVFTPYYWYILLNQSRLEALVRSSAQPGVPAFVQLEARDVSTGLVINPPTFTVIVYDASDELGRAPDQRSPAWNARNGRLLTEADGAMEKVYTAQHLYGHFYLVEWTYGEVPQPHYWDP